MAYKRPEMSAKKKIVLMASNVALTRKDYLVHVTLKNGEIYDVIFRRDPETNVMTQEMVMQQQWDRESWDNIPKLVTNSHMYLNTKTHELEVYYDSIPHHVPCECLLMTYDMFHDDEVGRYA